MKNTLRKDLSDHGRHRMNEGLRFFRAFRVRKKKKILCASAALRLKKSG